MVAKESYVFIDAGMVELADSGDLGSPAKSVRVRVPLPAPGATHFELGVGRRTALCFSAVGIPICGSSSVGKSRGIGKPEEIQ